MNKPIAITPILARGGRQAAKAPEGSAASGKALGEIACLSPDDALQRLSSTAAGLTPDQVEERLRSAGLNQVAHQARHTILGELIGRSINPLNLLLLSLATASYFLGDQRAAIVIAVMVVLSISLSFIQEHRSNNAADKLQRMVSINATVRRQTGAEAHDHIDVPIEQLVPGDIVLLSAGDMIPADLRLITAKDLFLNQSTLTGEAMPLEKVAAAHVGTAETPFDLPNICFMGSAVVSGIGCGVVVLTGPRTAFGLVASEIAKQRVLTSFDKGIIRFTWLMLGFIVVMAPLVFVINGLTKGNWLEALLFAVAVAVGLTPEMLPMIVTVNLAKGAMAMSRRKVIVKRLNSIQNFGAMNVLCTDKTGTLTQDRIILKRCLDIKGDNSDRVLEYAYLNSFHQSASRTCSTSPSCSMSSSRPASRCRPGSRRSTRCRSTSSGDECPSFSVAMTGFISSSARAPSKRCSRLASTTRSTARLGPRCQPLRFSDGYDGEAQRGRVSGRRGRLQGDAADADGVFGRRRGRPHLARLHRLSRSPEGDLRRRACDAEGQRRGGEDPTGDNDIVTRKICHEVAGRGPHRSRQ